MIKQTFLETSRLRQRPLEPSDAAAIQDAAGAREIADTMISLAHPYPAGEAKRHIARRIAEREAGHTFGFVIEHHSDRRFLGLIEVREIDSEHLQAELSFWLAVDSWGQGYMSEALGAVVAYGFGSLALNRLYAYNMSRNPASARVLEKSGFEREGLLRQRVRKWGLFEDVCLWAMLRDGWLASTLVDSKGAF